MKKSTSIFLVFVMASFLLIGCGKQPTEDINASKAAVDAVIAEGAEKYLIGKSMDVGPIGEAARILLKETTPLSSIGTSVQVRRRMIEAMFTDLIETLKDENEKRRTE